MRLEIDIAVARGPGGLELATTVAEGALGIFGPSGAGKSSLLAVVAGLLRPDRGRIVLDGRVLDDVAGRIHVPPHRRGVAVVFQHGHLLPHLDVEANLRYGWRLLPAPGRRVEVDEVVRLLELGDLLSRAPRTLSGGQRQRVALGRALLCSPKLLLLDEPLAALDPALKRQILPYLRRVREAFAIPMLHVSHDIGELLQVCDGLLLLDRGRMAGRGPLTAIAGDPRTLSLLHDAGLASVLHGRIASQHQEEGLTEVALVGGPPVWCAYRDGAVGSAVDLLLRPEDVVLSSGPAEGVSLQNQIPGRITALTPAGNRIVVAIDIGQPVLAEVSPRAAARLVLQPGAAVHVLFKAVALGGPTPAPAPSRS